MKNIFLKCSQYINRLIGGSDPEESLSSYAYRKSLIDKPMFPGISEFFGKK